MVDGAPWGRAVASVSLLRTRPRQEGVTRLCPLVREPRTAPARPLRVSCGVFPALLAAPWVLLLHS